MATVKQKENMQVLSPDYGTTFTQHSDNGPVAQCQYAFVRFSQSFRWKCVMRKLWAHSLRTEFYAKMAPLSLCQWCSYHVRHKPIQAERNEFKITSTFIHFHFSHEMECQNCAISFQMSKFVSRRTEICKNFLKELCHFLHFSYGVCVLLFLANVLIFQFRATGFPGGTFILQIIHIFNVIFRSCCTFNLDAPCNTISKRICFCCEAAQFHILCKCR